MDAMLGIIKKSERVLALRHSQAEETATIKVRKQERTF